MKRKKIKKLRRHYYAIREVTTVVCWHVLL